MRSPFALGARRAAVSLALVALHACASPPAGEPAGEPAPDDEKIMQGQRTATDAPWAVAIGRGCTAVILSRHYALTSAHCMLGAEQGATDWVQASETEYLYFGPMTYAIHPNYNELIPGGWPGAADYDIALLHFEGGLTRVPAIAELHDGVPPVDGEPTFIVSYGTGSDPGGSSDCDDGVYGTRRIAYYAIDAVNSRSLEIDYGSKTICGGDSGSPWHIMRGGRPRVVALTSGFHPVSQAEASRIDIIGTWIDQASRTLGSGIVCPAYYDGGPQYRMCFEPEQGAYSIATGGSHACAVLVDGRVRCWGSNSYGQIGTGMIVDLGGDFPRPADVLLADGERALQVAAGELHSCALLDDATVRCWGSAAYGQLGNGSMAGSWAAPVQVLEADGTPLDWVYRITAGGDHTCALRWDGTTVCWGRNDQGQLGDGTRTNRSRAVTVGKMQKVAIGGGMYTWVFAPQRDLVSIDAGQLHTCATRSDGGAMCWGENAQRQLGDGTTTDRLSPVAVYGATSVRTIAAGRYHSCLTRDTAPLAACWGYGGYGQLANGSTSSSYYPSWFDHLLGPGAQVTAGGWHTCFSNGTPDRQRCAGWNGTGAVGDLIQTGIVTSPAMNYVPRARIGSGGEYFTCTLLHDGAVMCHGWNDHGQLGLSAPSSTAIPHTVTGLHAP